MAFKAKASSTRPTFSSTLSRFWTTHGFEKVLTSRLLSRAWPVHVSKLQQAGAPFFRRRRSGWWPLTLPLEVLPLRHAATVQHSFWFFSFMWTTTSRGRKEASLPTPFTACSEGHFPAWSARAPGPAERGAPCVSTPGATALNAASCTEHCTAFYEIYVQHASIRLDLYVNPTTPLPDDRWD